MLILLMRLITWLSQAGHLVAADTQVVAEVAGFFKELHPMLLLEQL
jgi:hypothetical protein